MRREHGAAWLEPRVARGEHRVEHRLAEEIIAHPFGEDHVDLLRQLDLLHVALEHDDDVLHAILLHEPPSVLRHARRLHRVDTPSAGHTGPDGEHAGAGANVEHRLPGEAAAVVEDCVTVGVHAAAVLEHVLLVVEVSVRDKIIGKIE